MSESAIVGVLKALLTLDSAQYDAGMKRVQDSLAVVSKDFKKTGAAATALGTSLTKTLTLPLIAAGAGFSKVAMDFESSFAGIRKTVNATEPEFTKMAQAMRDLAKTIPVNVNELNRLGEAAGALGIPKAQVVEFARVMALLGVTTNVTSDQAAESIAKIQNIFGAAGKDTERFASTLVALGNNGASTESQILEMATRISGAGNAINMTEGQVLAFASALSSVGLEAEAGGSAISRVFIDIAGAVSKGGDELTNFATVAGMSTTAFKKAFAEDSAGAVSAFIDGLGRVKTSGGDVLAVLEKLGFSEIRIRDTLLRTAGAGDLLRDSLNLQGQAWKDNNALSNEAAERFKTTASQLTLLWNRIKDVGITIGNALLPLIKDTVKTLDNMVPVVAKVAEFFGALPVPVQAFVFALGAAAAAVGPLIYVAGQFITSWGLVAGAFAKTGLATKALALVLGPTGLTGVIAVLRTGLTLLTGPWGLVTAAAVALAPVLWNLVGGWDGIKAVLAPLGTALQSTWRFLTDIGTIVGFLAGSLLRDLWDWFKGVASAAIELGRAVLDSVLWPLRTLASWIGQIPGLSAAWGGFVSAVGATKDAVVGAAHATGQFLDDTRASVHSAAEAIRNDMGAASQRMAEAGMALVSSHGAATAAGQKLEVGARKAASAIDLLGDSSKKTTAKVDEFEQVVGKLVDRLGGSDLVTTATQWVAAIERIGGIGNLTHEELKQFQDDIVKAVEKMRLMGMEVPRTWQLIADSVRNADLLQATRDQLGESLKEFDIYRTKLLLTTHELAGGMTAAMAAVPAAISNQNITGAVQTNVDLFREGFKLITRDARQMQLDMSDAIVGMMVHWHGFHDGVLDIWGAIKHGIANILSDILNDFIGRFLNGMLSAIMGSRGGFGQAFAGLFGGGGGGGLAKMVGIGSSVGGAGGLGGGGAAAGVAGGIGLGTTIAATGGIAAAALIAYGVIKKGLFRGGEEALKVNPARDQFLGQFGGAGLDEQSGFHKLAAKLAEIGKTDLFEKLRTADTMKKFDAAAAAIENALEEADKKSAETTDSLSEGMDRSADSVDGVTDVVLELNKGLLATGEAIRAIKKADLASAIAGGNSSAIASAQSAYSAVAPEASRGERQAGSSAAISQFLQNHPELQAEASSFLSRNPDDYDRLARMFGIPGFHAGGLIRAHSGMFLRGAPGPGEIDIRALSGESVLNRMATERMGGESGINAINSGQAPRGAQTHSAGGDTYHVTLNVSALASVDRQLVTDRLIPMFVEGVARHNAGGSRTKLRKALR